MFDSKYTKGNMCV